MNDDVNSVPPHHPGLLPYFNFFAEKSLNRNYMANTRGVKINFLKQFQDERSLQLHKLSAVQFMEVWMHYDKDGKENVDISGNFSPMLELYLYIFSKRKNINNNITKIIIGNGFIEGEELDDFLREFITSLSSDDNIEVIFWFDLVIPNYNKLLL